jgi:hypothetical protein
MKNRELIFLLLPLVFLLLFFSDSLFAKELNIWAGKTDSDDTKTGCIVGVDYLCYDVSKKIKVGYRTAYLKTERKEHKTGNGLCTYVPFLFGGVSTFEISKNFAFNIKYFVGLALYSYRGREEKDYLDLSILNQEISIGISYRITERLGIGVDLQLRGGRDLNTKKEVREDDKFNIAGAGAVWSINYKFKK